MPWCEVTEIVPPKPFRKTNDFCGKERVGATDRDSQA